MLSQSEVPVFVACICLCLSLFIFCTLPAVSYVKIDERVRSNLGKYMHARKHTHTSLWVVLGDVGLREVMNDLLLEDFGVVDEQLGSLIHQILRDVDTGRLPGLHTHTHTHAHTL